MFTEYTPELAYCLGFIWGDGYIGKNSIHIEIVKEDLIEILPVFEKCFKFKYSERYRENRKPQACIRINDKNLFKFLEFHGYIPKRFTSPESIIDLIPKNLQRFWYLGFLDADGNWYYNFKNSCSQCTFSGNYKQNWKFIENIFNYLNIKFGKQIIIREKNSSSSIRITGKQNVVNFSKYLYEGHQLGLIRKRNKIKDIDNHHKKQYLAIGELAHFAKLKNKDVKEIKQLFSKLSIKEIADIYNTNTKIIRRIKNNETWKQIN